MFATNMDSARDVGGAPSTVLIPMRFVWPYGGRSVFLSGSFARRWSELIPMTPVEGCPTVSQAIYSVTPGYHQALQLGQDSFSPFEPRGQRCQMCLRSDSLHKVMERLANPGVRRLVIVEAGSKRVEGIVSLSDVFKFLLS